MSKRRSNMDSMYKLIDKKALRDEIIKQKGMVS